MEQVGRGISAPLAKGGQPPIRSPLLPLRGNVVAATMIAPSITSFETESAALPRKTRHGSERRQRSHMVQVRFDDGELAKLDRRTDDTGLSRSAYLRMRALDNPGPRAQRRVSVDMRALARANGDLNRVGNNLNQIAHALNSRGEIPAIADIEIMRTELLATLTEIRRAFGRDRQG
jgi:hypothetical protein